MSEKQEIVDIAEDLELVWWRANEDECGWEVRDPDTKATASLLCAMCEQELDGVQQLTPDQIRQVDAWDDEYQGVVWDETTVEEE